MSSETAGRQARDVEVVDQELRLLAAVRTSTRALGGRPGTELVDELLDERLTMEAQTPGQTIDCGRDHQRKA